LRGEDAEARKPILTSSSIGTWKGMRRMEGDITRFTPYAKYIDIFLVFEAYIQYPIPAE
jgi:hypothetical protein